MKLSLEKIKKLIVDYDGDAMDKTNLHCQRCIVDRNAAELIEFLLAEIDRLNTVIEEMVETYDE